MEPSPPAPAARRQTLTVLAVAWVTALLAVFFCLELPNNPPAVRWQFWLVVPQLLDLVDPPARNLNSGHTGWGYFPQRFDLVGVAFIILAGAWGVGHLLLRLVRPALPARCVERTVFAFGTGLAALSLLTLAAGLAGALSRPLFIGVITAAVALELAF